LETPGLVPKVHSMQNLETVCVRIVFTPSVLFDVTVESLRWGTNVQIQF